MTAPTHRAPTATRVTATVLWLVYVAGMVTSSWLNSEIHKGIWSPFAVTFTAFATVGWLLAYRRPGNALGWLFLSIGVLTAIGVVTDGEVQLALHRGWRCDGIVLFSAWVQMWFWYPLVTIATAYTVLLFPNGLPSRRWRPVFWILTATLALITVMAALSPTVEFGKAHLANPIGVSLGSANDVETTPLFKAGTLVMTVCIIASILSLFLRFRRSRGLERAQVKWFLLAAAVMTAAFSLAAAIPSFNNSSVGNVFFPIVLTFLPVACGLAVLRYRLYDIDRVVSRTVAYFVVTGAVVGVYVGVVALIESGLGFSSSVAVAASTLAAAAMFQPLRQRVQLVVDRRFDRAAYDARRTVEAFSGRLRDEVDADAVRAELLATVATSIAPVKASLWVAS